MVKVTMKKGYWEREAAHTLLYHEDCPNKKCKARNLRYTPDMTETCCPECRAFLPGAAMADSMENRVIYHIEPSNFVAFSKE